MLLENQLSSSYSIFTVLMAYCNQMLHCNAVKRRISLTDSFYWHKDKMVKKNRLNAKQNHGHILVLKNNISKI